MTNVLIGQTFSTIFKALGWKLVHVILYMLLVPKMLLVALHHIYIYTTMLAKGLHLCLRDLANARIREADSQNMAGSCLVRKKFEFSGLVCSRLGVFNLII